MESWSDELHEDLPQLENLSLVQTTPSMPTDAMPQMENLSLAQTTPSMLGTLIGEDPVDEASKWTYENPKSATLKRFRVTKPFTRCVRVKLDHPPPPVLDDEDSEPRSRKKDWWWW